MEKDKTLYCSACGCTDMDETLVFDGPHYSKIRCSECGKFRCWGKRPENEGKRDKNKHSPASMKVTRCQMCGRDKERLGTRGVLEVHHIEEIQNGGPDTTENIWVVCTSCHKLIHHQRTYLNQHLSTQYTAKELQADMDRYNVPQDTQAIMKRIFDKHEYQVEP